MDSAKKFSIVGLVLVGGVLLAGTAFAGGAAQLASPLIEPDAFVPLSVPVSNDILGSQSGGQGVTIERIDMLANSMNLNAEMNENLLFSSSTGANQVSDSAFSDASGISTVIQNSGNQVIINNAFILNLQMQ